MHVVFLCLLAFLTIAPILLAWVKGDRILDALARRRRIRRQIRRRRATRSLPLRRDALDALLKAEDLRDRIEEQISRALIRFRGLPSPRPPADDRDDALQQTAQLLLTRESRFNGYLDLAWLQSETIEVQTREVEALRRVAGIEAGAFQGGGELPGREAGPAQQLLRNLNAAARRREQVDRKLRSMRTRPPAGGPEARFDATVE